MKILTRLFILFFWVCAASPAAFAHDRPALSPALWKVSDQDTTIYLFGTIHALPPGLDWLNSKISAALSDSDELRTEIPDTPDAQMAELVETRATLPQGQNLREALSADVREDYEAALQRLGLPLHVFDRYKPWFAAISLASIPMAKAGFTMENGAEALLIQQATAKNLGFSAFETADEQLDLFDSLPADVEVGYLGSVAKYVPQMQTALPQLVQAWAQGDLATLTQLSAPESDDPELIEQILVNRNRSWATWIITRLENPGTVFVAVGAGHLIGKDSVQDLLLAQSIVAERVQ